MAYKVRFTVSADVPACAAMEPTRFGCQNERQQELWAEQLRTLLGQGRALSVVVVDEADKPLAFGLSLFISEELRQYLLGSHNRTLLGGAMQQRLNLRTVLEPRAILRGHRGEGLNLLGFYGWRNDLSPDALAEVQGLLYQSFHYLHRGYHLKSFLKEVYGKQEEDLYRKLGMRVHKTPADYSPSHQHLEPYLVGVERAEVAFPLRIADLFMASSPSVLLTRNHCRTRRQEEVAQLAYLLRLRDAEIAECLGISQNTVYNYWHRMAKRLPSNDQTYSGRAGRRECLAYIAHHPEVIYPLRIHTLFYKKPELARKHPLPLGEGGSKALVTNRYSHSAVVGEAS